MNRDCTISEKDRSQLGEESDDDGRRVDEVGIDGQPMRRNETDRVRGPPAHHPDASALVVGDEADVAIGDELVERDATLFRVGVRSGQPRSMGTGLHLLTGDDGRGLVDGDAVQHLNSHHRRTVTPHEGMTVDDGPAYPAESTPAPARTHHRIAMAPTAGGR